jgi:hypothetical protein
MDTELGLLRILLRAFDFKEKPSPAPSPVPSLYSSIEPDMEDWRSASRFLVLLWEEFWRIFSLISYKGLKIPFKIEDIYEVLNL